jgi:hypothetical protein
MAFNKIIPTPVGADYAHEQNNPDTRRCRFIAHTADLSALGGFHDIQIKLFICIIGPGWISRYPDETVKKH